MSNADAIVARIADIFERRGAEAYLGEAVTVAEHMLQTATLAQAAGAPDALVVAALLHDIGHLTNAFGSYSSGDVADRHHDEAGAELLAGHFPELVCETVRLHVAAKRYLCAVEPDYYSALSTASKHSLALQGGAMNLDELAGFRRQPFHSHAVHVRRWDDGGKTAGLRTMPFSAFRPLVQRVAAGA